MPAAYRAPLLFTQSGMVRCDWLSGCIAFCREGRLALVAVCKEREKTGLNNMADIAFCIKLNMDFSMATKYNTDFGENSIYLKMALIAFWNQTPQVSRNHTE